MKFNSYKGFSLFEVLITVALVGVVASLAINSFSGDLRASSSAAALKSSMARLNSAVNMYIADGGDLSDAGTVQAVLDKLKRARPANAQVTDITAGSGRFIDVRLVSEQGSSSNGSGVVSWDSANQTFVFAENGNGTTAFKYNDNITEASVPADVRDDSVKTFNSSSGWVWNGTGSAPANNDPFSTTYNGSGAGSPFDPSASISNGSSASSGGVGTGSSSSTTGAEDPPALPSPTFQPQGGRFNDSNFPSSVTITNGGASTDDGTLRYRINGGAWIDYTGPIPVSSGIRIEAQNFASNTLNFSDSAIVSADFYSIEDNFSGNVTGQWVNPFGGNSDTQTITPPNVNGATTFQHGDTTIVIDGQTQDSLQPNLLAYRPTTFTNIVTDNSFSLGELDITNGVTFNNSEADRVTLRLNLYIDNLGISQTVNVRLNLIDQPDNGNLLGSADIIEIAAPSPLTFDHNGVTYTLRLEWVTLDPALGVTGGTQGNRFYAYEGGTAHAELRGTFVPNQ
jgi:prepilin-type N-terminal cleavage/methylation domain-containing protein